MNAVWQWEENEETPGIGDIVHYERYGWKEDAEAITIRHVVARDVSQETWETLQEARATHESLDIARKVIEKEFPRSWRED
jgi:hypothetical protein